MGRVVGIDFGLARIGVAISDEMKMLASAIGKVEVAKTNPETIKKLLEFLETYQIDAFVVGNPLHMSGKVSPLAELAQAFAALLKEHVTVPVLLWDERLSTMQAQRSLKETGMKRKKRAKVVDTVSATIFLQSYLDTCA